MSNQSHLSQFTFQVQIFDTDCYGVMWHGSCVKWLEMARCQLLAECEIPLSYPGQGYVYPVVEQHHQFKQPLRLNDKIVIETVATIDRVRLRFDQTLYRQDDADRQPLLVSQTTCIVTDADFKPMRRIPPDLVQSLTQRTPS